MTQGALADTFKRFPLVARLATSVLSGAIDKLVLDCKLNEQYSLDLVEKRVAAKLDRKDFLTRILEHRDEHNICDIQIEAHSADFVTAGSETTAIALSYIIYYLLKTPKAERRLKEEIRKSFTSYEEINAASSAMLVYLNAVCLECLRIYPPLPFALPREVPEGGDSVDGIFPPAGVSFCLFIGLLLLSWPNWLTQVTVSVNPIAACLDKANFLDPWKFKPERWLEKSEKDILEASQPFSLGPRGCLGRR